MDLEFTIEKHIKELSVYVGDIVFDDNLTIYEQLNILSSLLNIFNSVDKYIKIKDLKITKIFFLSDYKIEDYLYENKSYLPDEMKIFLPKEIKNPTVYILHKLAIYIYMKELAKNNFEFNQKLSCFCEKTLSIFLKNEAPFLDNYVEIYSREENFLYHLCKGEEIFARAFVLFMQANGVASLSKYILNLNHYILLYDDFLELLYLYNDGDINLANDNSHESYECANSIYILENDIRASLNLIVTENKGDENTLMNSLINLISSSDTLKNVNIERLINSNIDKDNVDNNFNYIKSIVDTLDHKSLYDMEYKLLSEIEFLNYNISSIESALNKLKSKEENGENILKERDMQLLIYFLECLKEEYMYKIKIKKSIEASVKQYNQDCISYYEVRNQEIACMKIIKEKLLEADYKKEHIIDIKDLNKAIVNIFGLSYSSIKGSILDLENNGSIKIKLSSKDINQSTSDRDIYNKSDSYVSVSKMVNSSNIINTILKDKIKSTYVNSRNKFKSKAYSEVNENNLNKDFEVYGSGMKNAVEVLFNEAELISKGKGYNKETGNELDI